MTESTSIIRPIPDSNTAESIAYGSKYRFAKSSKFYWDSVEDYLVKLQKQMTLDIIDPAFCEYVVKRNPAMIYAQEPPVDSVDHIRDLHTLRVLLNVKKAIHDVDVRRTENLQYAQIHGISEYSAKMRENVIDDDLWKASTLRFDEPIEFDTIRAKRDMDEKVAKYDAAILERRIQQYRKMRDMVATMKEEAEAESEDDSEIEPEQPVEFEILKEVEEVDFNIIEEVEIDDAPEGESESSDYESTTPENTEPNDCSEPDEGIKDDCEVTGRDFGQPVGSSLDEHKGEEDEEFEEQGNEREDNAEAEVRGADEPSEDDHRVPAEEMTEEDDGESEEGIE